MAHYAKLRLLTAAMVPHEVAPILNLFLNPPSGFPMIVHQSRLASGAMGGSTILSVV